jgi:TRAP-type C4-dicarboxylate transport system substrate-binding protein
MNKIVKITKLALVGAGLCLAALPAAASETWKIQSHLQTGHSVFQAEQAWVDNVNVMLGGRLTLELLVGNAVV